MSLDHAIMGFLSSEDSTGYELKTRCFDRLTSHYWTADQAQIYRTLDRLERQGLVSAKLQVQRGRPDRNVYKLTAAGRKSLDGWLEDYHPAPPHRDPFLIQIAFADHLSDSATLELFARAREERQTRLETLRSHAMKLSEESEGDSDRGVMLERMTYDAALAKERATIDWLDNCVESIRTIPAGTASKRRPSRKGPAG